MSLPPFDRVVTEHGQVVLRVCRALLPLHDAEDAAADAFLAALEAYPRLRPDSDVKSWLVTIAHRKAVDILRRKARHAMPVQDMPERGLGAEPSLPDQTLWQAVRELPTKQRHAVAYHYVADLAYAEVAAIMGTSEAAARRNAADGIKALRRTYPPASGSGQGTLPTKEMT
ncbi:MAG TPA: sigma-70 family RNA polymerase sigma factor [Streptosporangiaceae bacterium]|nr:sigma-70 family RNA polymerase sigma factor [Streptosporangiaceae bacterium]